MMCASSAALCQTGGTAIINSGGDRPQGHKVLSTHESTVEMIRRMVEHPTPLPDRPIRGCAGWATAPQP